MVEKLTVEVRKGRPRGRQQEYRRSGRSHSRRRTRAVSRDSNNNNYCYYHDRFRERARKCSKPCSWTPAVTNSKN